MAKVEVDQSELEGLRRARMLLEQLNGSSKARPLFERAIKAEFPDVVTQEEQAEQLAQPFIQRVTDVEKKLEERLAAIDAKEAAAREKAADAELHGAFDRLRQAGYTNEGLGKIAALMADRNIPDPEAAAALYDRQNPKPVEAPPSSWEPQSWNYSGEDPAINVKELFGNPDAWADKEVGKILADVRRGSA